MVAFHIPEPWESLRSPRRATAISFFRVIRVVRGQPGMSTQLYSDFRVFHVFRGSTSGCVCMFRRARRIPALPRRATAIPFFGVIRVVRGQPGLSFQLWSDFRVLRVFRGSTARLPLNVP